MNKDVKKRKRQDDQNVCQLALYGFQPTAKLSCCENNGTCIAGPKSCSSTNKLVQCWKIRGFNPCTRNDPTSRMVCQHQDGIYCLKGKTDWAYGRPEQESINWLLSRDRALSSLNGAGGSFYIRYPVTCSDSFASGACQITNNVKQIYNYFEYQVEVCGSDYDFIVDAPKLPKNLPSVSTLTPNTQTASPFSDSGDDSSHGLQASGFVGIVFAVVVVACGLVFLMIKIKKRIEIRSARPTSTIPRTSS